MTFYYRTLVQVLCHGSDFNLQPKKAPEFDYGDFRKLEDQILNSVDINFDKFAYVFTDEGNYVFESSLDSQNVLFVHVAGEGTACADFGIRNSLKF